MGTADILILAFVLFFAVRGIIRGFIMEVIGLLGIVLAFLFSFMIYTPVLNIVQAIGFGGDGASVAAYVLGFIIIYVIVVVLGHLLHKALSVIHLGWLNRIAGFIFGGVKGTVIVGVILWAALYILPNNSRFATDINNSRAAQTAMSVVPYVYGKINDIAGIDRINPFNKQ